MTFKIYPPSHPYPISVLPLSQSIIIFLLNYFYRLQSALLASSTVLFLPPQLQSMYDTAVRSFYSVTYVMPLLKTCKILTHLTKSKKQAHLKACKVLQILWCSLSTAPTLIPWLLPPSPIVSPTSSISTSHSQLSSSDYPKW